MIEKAGLRQRKKEQMTERLQRVALELMGERGFDAVSVDEICDAADVSKSTYYRYFETKEDVLLGRIEEHLELMQAALAECPLEEPLITAAKHAYRRYAETIQADRETQLLVTAIARATPAIAARNLSRHKRWEAVLRSEAQRRAPRGSDPLLPWVQAAAVAAVMLAASEFWLECGAERPVSELVDKALDAVNELKLIGEGAG